MDEHPLRGVFLGDAQARRQRHRGRAGTRPRRQVFLGLRVKTDRRGSAAYPQAGSNAFVANLGTLAGVYRTPSVARGRGDRRLHEIPTRWRAYRGNGRPEARLCDSRRMVDEAAAEAHHRPHRTAPGRNMIPPEAMPFKSGLTFTYDCGEFAKKPRHGTEASRRLRFSKTVAQERSAQPGAKLRGIGLSNTIERAAAGGFEAAEIRLRPWRANGEPGCRASITQGPGSRDGSTSNYFLCGPPRLSIPGQVHYIQGDTDKVANGEGTGGSRLGRASAGSASLSLANRGKIVTKATAIRRPPARRRGG